MTRQRPNHDDNNPQDAPDFNAPEDIAAHRDDVPGAGDNPAEPPRDDHFDDLIQAVLEGPADDPARLGLINAIRADQAAMRELRLTEDTLAELRRPVDAPDFSRQILDRTHNRRAFLPRRLRRFVDRGRLAAAAALLLALTVFTVAQRVWPDATRLTTAQRPVSDVPRAFFNDATNSVTAFTSSMEQARAALVPFAAEREPSLTSTSPDAASHRLEAFILQSFGRDGSRLDSVLFYDPTAPREQSLRVLHFTELSETARTTASREPLLLLEPAPTPDTYNANPFETDPLP